TLRVRAAVRPLHRRPGRCRAEVAGVRAALPGSRPDPDGGRDRGRPRRRARRGTARGRAPPVSSPSLTLLDGVRWRGDPVTGERGHALLAALVLASPRAVGVGDLVDDVWADD